MNHPFDLLQSNLLDLLYELRNSDVRLIVCGGYGLYLKHREIERTNAATLFTFIPPARSTNDLDLFLATQILVDPESAKVVLEAMRALQCIPVAAKENFQFTKGFDCDGKPSQVKFDFLTKMPSDPSEAAALDIQKTRVKNKKGHGIHAYLTAEAIAVEDSPMPIEIEGLRTTGEEYKDKVYLPQAYAYLMMKLFAFRDWEKTKQKSDYASKHALDLYSIVAMMTEIELAKAEESSQKYRDMTMAQEAALIVNEYFSQKTGMGIIRLREHPSFPQNEDTAGFISVLTDLFPV